MDEDDLPAMSALLDLPIAALATLHRGEPAVSMAPFVLPGGSTAALIHVSAPTSHTRDMAAHPCVALLVVAPAAAGVSAPLVAGFGRATSLVGTAFGAWLRGDTR